jgi:phage portal protein BeeE
MGLGSLFTRSATHNRVISSIGGPGGFSPGSDGAEFAFVNGLPWTSTGGNYRAALSIPGVWRATLLLSDLIGGLPWHAYRQRVDGPPQRLDPAPPLLDRPNPPDVRMTTFSGWVMDLLLNGNAIGLWADRNSEGWPTAAVPVPAEQVVVRRVARGDDIPLPEGTIAYGIGSTWYPADAVFHVKGPCEPGALRGMGILEHHLAATFGLAHRQARWAHEADNAYIPTGVLKATDTMTADQARALKERWRQAQQTRTVAVL